MSFLVETVLLAGRSSSEDVGVQLESPATRCAGSDGLDLGVKVRTIKHSELLREVGQVLV